MRRGNVNDENPLFSAGQGWGLEDSDWKAQRLLVVGEQGGRAAVRAPLPLVAAPMLGD